MQCDERAAAANHEDAIGGRNGPLGALVELAKTRATEPCRDFGDCVVRSRRGIDKPDEIAYCIRAAGRRHPSDYTPPFDMLARDVTVEDFDSGDWIRVGQILRGRRPQDRTPAPAGPSGGLVL